MSYLCTIVLYAQLFPCISPYTPTLYPDFNLYYYIYTIEFTNYWIGFKMSCLNISIIAPSITTYTLTQTLQVFIARSHTYSYLIIHQKNIII